MHNCLNCTLFYVFDYIDSTKISYYFVVTIENSVSCFILTQDEDKHAFKITI